MSVVAKFKCWNHSVADNASYAVVQFSAVTDDSPENKSWSKYTPAGQLTMTITNPDAFNQFEQGKNYLLKFEEC